MFLAIQQIFFRKEKVFSNAPLNKKLSPKIWNKNLNFLHQNQLPLKIMCYVIINRGMLILEKCCRGIDHTVNRQFSSLDDTYMDC